ncbi:MAG: hypothetical protein NTX66_04060, partial [Candidatus Falkowbacteria bacterium]|nr:hypothetical protein [Candidatus Falkowbacteria bacterium]
MIKNHKFALIVFGIILATALILRIMSPEDDWICQNGAWIKHGSPRSAKPSQVCPGSLKQEPEVLNSETAGPTSSANNTSNLVGNDRDVHGCIGSAGYSWCEFK